MDIKQILLNTNYKTLIKGKPLWNDPDYYAKKKEYEDTLTKGRATDDTIDHHYTVVESYKKSIIKSSKSIAIGKPLWNDPDYIAKKIIYDQHNTK